jgi:vitamin B12 transporter
MKYDHVSRQIAGVLLLSGILLAENPVTSLPTLSVQASRMPTESSMTGSTFQRLTQEDLGAFGNIPLVDYLSRTPGINFAGSGPRGSVGTLNVRGATQKYLLVRLDGVNISDPSSSQIAPQIEHLRLGNVTGVDILRGSQSSLYGGQAVAGVIEITTKPPMPGTRETVLTLEAGSYDTYSSLLETRAASERGTLSGHVEFTDSKGFSAADENNGNQESDGYRNFNLGLSSTWAVSEELIWRNSFRYLDTEIEFDSFEFGVGPVDDEGTERTEGEQIQVATGLEWTLQEGRQVHDLQLSYFRTDRDTKGLFPATFLGERLEADYVGRQQLSSTFGLLFGFNAMEESADTRAEFDKSNTIYGAFLQIDLRPQEDLYLTLTGRTDEHSEFGNQLTWKGTAAYQALESTRLRTSVGTGFRAPSLFELFDSQFGNDSLDPETSLSWDAGIDHSLRNGKDQFSLTYFILDVTDQIDFVFPAGYSQVEGDSQRQGLELAYRSRVTDHLLLSAAYTHMLKAEDNKGNPLLRVPEHDVNLSAIYTIHPWSFSTRIAYISGVEDLAFSFDGPPTSELDSYWVADGLISFQASEALSVYLRIENIFDEQYQQTRGYGTPDRSIYAGLRLTL